MPTAETIARDLLLVPVMRWHREQWNRRADAGKMPSESFLLMLLYNLLVEHGP